MATRNTNGRRRAFKGSATALARSVAARAKVPKTLAVAQGVRPRQGQDVVRLREALGVNQALFGRLTGYSTRTIAALENNEAELHARHRPKGHRGRAPQGGAAPRHS